MEKKRREEMPEKIVEKQNDKQEKTIPLKDINTDTSYRAGVKELKNWDDDTQVTKTEAEKALQNFLGTKQGE